ncbi:hypothetical protein BW727_101537 [Jeotgalibaca dankookensis]|uniref:Uncharacterized protein n=1 Tax=Jeotgalibaca dankookensis TaxID=708126 RepID=A0A1S6IQU9_9LACT|nr:hypothetical protein [Jeotgalibaca dankookensis]AQS53904.1 hypothetical protein BW727_101537 [Jeotgalibaca dankookensis]
MEYFDLDWDDLLNVDSLSLEEERNTSAAESDYIVRKNSENTNVEYDASVLKNKKVINYAIDVNSLMGNTIKINKFDKDNFVNFFNNEKFIEVNPLNKFPKNKSLFSVFFLLDNISKENISESVFNFTCASKDGEDVGRVLIDTLIYLNYLSVIESFFIPTSKFFTLSLKKTDEKVLSFIKDLSNYKTIKECLMIQLYGNNFDSITREIIFDKLSNDPSVLHEELLKEQTFELTKNLRSWYLELRSTLIL